MQDYCEIKKTTAILKDMRLENTVSSCIEKCHQISSEVNIDDSNRNLLKTLIYEVLDTLIMQLEVRFSDFESIQFVELLDPNHFISYKESFPSSKLNSLMNKYPFFNSERLKNELKNIYSDTGKHFLSTYISTSLC